MSDEQAAELRELLREAEEELAHIADDDGSIAPLRRRIVALLRETERA